ncbi:hypothetical protein CF327_g127 [Tilletia walkeri]|nr:hypothetical protein CF327_g127 [Tilletia walkeri]
MAGFNDILNPAPRSASRASNGSMPGPDSHQHSHHQSQSQPAASSLSPTHSLDDVSHPRRSVDMSIDIPPPISTSRPSHITIPSPSAGTGGMSRTSISNLLGDSVESPRSRPTLSGTSSPSDENRRSLHPPWPGSSSEASATGGTGTGPQGSIVGRLKRFFGRKEGGGPMSGPGLPGTNPSVSPQPQPAYPPHQLGGASSSSRMSFNQSPSGGSMLTLPVTPGTPHSPAEFNLHHSSYPLPPSHQQQHPSGGYSSSMPGSVGLDPTRRGSVRHPDGNEFSPTLNAVGGMQQQQQHPYHQHLQPGSQHPHAPPYHLQQQAHHAQHLSDRASLSPTTVIQSLPSHSGQQYIPSELGPPRGVSLTGPPGSDMSPPPVPASITRSSGGPAGMGTKRSASSGALSVPDHSVQEGISPGAGASTLTVAGRKRSRASRDHSSTSTPASSRPTSPVDNPSASALISPGDGIVPVGGAPPAPTPAPIPAEFRDPKVNVKKLPPPKFAKANAVSPGAGSATSSSGTAGAVTAASGGASGSTSGAQGVPDTPQSVPTARTPGAPKDWMSAGISSAAVGLATGLDGGAAAAAAAAAATAALKAREMQERERGSAVDDGHAMVGGQQPNKRRKSSSATSTSAKAKAAAALENGASEEIAGGSAAAARARIAKRCESSGGGTIVNPVKDEWDNASVGMEVDPDQPVGSDAGSSAMMNPGPPEGAPNPYSFVPKQRTASTASSTAQLRPLSRGNNNSSGSINLPAAPSHPAAPVIKADPIPYDPRPRRTPMGSVRKPIYAHEIEAIKATHRNPLRWKYEEQAAGLVNAAGGGSSPEAKMAPGSGSAAVGKGAANQVSASASGSGSRKASLPVKPEPGRGSVSVPMETVGSTSSGNGAQKRKWDNHQNGHAGLDRDRSSGNGSGTARPPPMAEREREREREPAQKKRLAGAVVTGGVIAKGPDNNEVSEHYNLRQEVGVVARRDSKIFPLKKFNNWAKNVLIQRFSQNGCRVLDMGCGKGGDLNKWARANASGIVMIDIAGVSVGQAEARYKDARPKHRFEADFYTFDCFSRALGEVVSASTLAPKFDNVTLQFCMHYGWDSVSKARCLLENVGRYLKPGGFFVGTIPDADNLMNRLGALKGDELTFGNRYYHVTFEQKERQPPFGNKYWFFLEDAVDEVPEYVVDWEQFEGLAREAGLRLVYKRTFEQMYFDAATASTNPESQLADREAGNDLQRMGVPLPRYEGAKPMDPELWEAVCLYMGFAFERVID